MWRKIILGSSIVAAILIATLGYLHLNSSQPGGNSEVFPFNPNSFGIAIRINYPGDWLDKSYTEKTLVMLASQNNMAQTALDLATSFAITQLGDPSPLYLLINGDGKNTSWVLAKYSQTIKHIPAKWILQDSVKYGEDSQIFRYTNPADNRSIFYAESRKMHLFSPNKMEIEQFLRTPPRREIENSQDPIENLIKTADSHAAANVFINFGQASNIFQTFLKSGSLQPIRSFAKFGVWDVQQQNDEIFISGLNLPFDGFATDKPSVDYTAHKILPLQTVSYQSKVTNFKGAEFRQLCSQTDTPWFDLISRNLNGEETEAMIYDPTHPTWNSEAVIFTAESNSQASDLARVLSPSNGSDATNSVGIWPSSLKQVFKSTQSLSHFGVYENYIIVAQPVIIDFIRKAAQSEKTLANWENYQNLAESFTSGSTSMLYINPRYYTSFLRTHLLPKSVNQLKSFGDSLVYLSGVGVQTVAQDQHIYTNIHSQIQHRQSDHAAKAIWATKLDTTLASKPILVQNHYTKNNEVLVQDVLNRLYLIDEKGTILWKRDLSEPILGSVQQVDLFNNGKLQMFFNTRTMLYIIDRNGGNVNDYPKKLPFPASAGARIYDYDNRQDFRILVPCIDKHVYCYNITGTEIEGWAFDKAKNEIQTETQYAVWDEKDYLLFGDNKHCYILNRRGEERIQLTQQFGPKVGSNIVLDENAPDKQIQFVAHDKQGTIYRISLDGATRPYKFDDFSPNHYFFYKDFDGDLVADYIFFDNNILSVYNLAGEKIFEYKHASSITTAPIFFDFSRNDKRIGLYSESEHKAYLIEHDGQISSGFPVEACCPFTIGKLVPSSGRMNLFAGALNGYLYNYQIDL